MTERWRPVAGFDSRYEVSDLGHVRSLDYESTFPDRWGGTLTRTFRGRTLKPRANGTGYLQVRLHSTGGKPAERYVHRLVLETFVGPCPEGMEVRHLNGDPADNRVENLCWGTRSENEFDKVRHGNHPQARKTRCPNGHPFTASNTYFRPAGGRECRKCRANRHIKTQTPRNLEKGLTK